MIFLIRIYSNKFLKRKPIIFVLYFTVSTKIRKLKPTRKQFHSELNLRNPPFLNLLTVRKPFYITQFSILRLTTMLLTHSLKKIQFHSKFIRVSCTSLINLRRRPFARRDYSKKVKLLERLFGVRLGASEKFYHPREKRAAR